MTYFSYQCCRIHAKGFGNLEDPAQTRIYKATFKLTDIRDIAAQLISERGLGETLSDAILSHDIADSSFKTVHFLFAGNTDWPGHMFKYSKIVLYLK
jgi:hypothetical protein